MLFAKFLKFGISKNLSSVEEFYSLPNDKILGISKLKTFADNKFEMAEIAGFAFERAETIWEKGENGDYRDFVLFPHCLLKVSQKAGLCGKGLKGNVQISIILQNL